MIFKYEFVESFLLIMLSISFAIDGSLPIRQDENAMYPNAEGHSNQVNTESNQIKKGQNNLRKTDSETTSSMSSYSNKVRFTENVLNDEETNLISNYDYDKLPSEKKFQDDTAIDNFIKMKNEETFTNVSDISDEPSSTTINDEISSTIKPFTKLPIYTSLDAMPTAKNIFNFSKESIGLTSDPILSKLNTYTSSKFSIEKSTQNTIPLTTKNKKFFSFNSSKLEFTSQRNALDQTNISTSSISPFFLQRIRTIINSSNHSTETYNQNDKSLSKKKFNILIDNSNKMQNKEELISTTINDERSTTVESSLYQNDVTLSSFITSTEQISETTNNSNYFTETHNQNDKSLSKKKFNISIDNSNKMQNKEEPISTTINDERSTTVESSLDTKNDTLSSISTTTEQISTTTTNNSNDSTKSYMKISLPSNSLFRHSMKIYEPTTLKRIETDAKKSSFTQDNVTNEIELSTATSLLKSFPESTELDEHSTDGFNYSNNEFQSDSNISDDSQMTTTDNLFDKDLSTVEITQTVNKEFQSPTMRTTLSSLITNNSTSSNFYKAQSTSNLSSSTNTKRNINSTLSSIQTLVKPCETHKQIQKLHEIRVEVPENELIDIYWTCPPDKIHSDGSAYKWFIVSSKKNKYTNPLPSDRDPVTGKSILKIKKNSTGMGARYVCIGQNSGPFSNQQMFFYQIVVLQSKWIDVGSINTTVFYINQKAIINCPHGDIIKNNIRLDGYNCSSRITIVETSLNSTKDIYRCSNSKNETIKMPSILSSTNCSLALMGCDLQIGSTDQRDETKFEERTTDTINIDRCNFTNSSYLISPRQPLLCHGKVYIRFYFDNSEEKCLPFETNICGDDFFSFSSLQECVETCIKIQSNIANCFYPQNVDESHHCPDKKLKGNYLAHYDIENGECQWFYHCGVSNLTKNAFQSISQCDKICVLSKRNIKIESIKACRYQKNMNSTIIYRNRTALWVYNKITNKCETNLAYHDRIVRFKSKEKCENVCKGLGSTEICITRPDNGNCQQQSIQWFYSKITNQCVKIFDGGCGESLNRFNSKANCENMCVNVIHRFLTISYANNITVTKVMLARNTKTTTERKSSYKSTKTTVIRKRSHRQISYLNMTTFKFNQIKTLVKSLPKYFNVTDRELDFDPCYKEALLNTCNFDVGQNKYHMNRYTFKLGTGTCNKVKFSGCRSGENLFDDANDCKSACETRLHAALKSPGCQNPFFHNCMAPDNVLNKRNNQRYFYLSSEKKCVEFKSTNNPECLSTYFTSIKQCQKTCLPSPPKELMLHNRCFAKIVLWEMSCSEDQKIKRWFYFKDIDQCLQYSTCPVNYPGNTFQSKQDCEDVCKASNMLTVCSLPMDTGVGELRKGKYYYNRRLGKCQLFYYNGSLGNLNRFKTRVECEKACSVPMKHSDEIKFSSLTSSLDYYKEYKGTKTNEAWLNDNIDEEYCFDSHKYGGCVANQPQVFIKKYYYDSYSKQCEPYMFSGCGLMSRNSFDSMSICDKMCTERISRKTSSLCSQRVAKCSDSQYVYWTYNVERGTCEPFQSCINNTNQFFFTTSKHCMEACAPNLPLKKDLFDICHLPRTNNENCTILSERWFHDPTTKTCHSEMNCEHYGNNFPSRISCLAACQPISLKDICQLPMDKGPCTSNDTINYYFDWSTQICKSFSYGGCLGNRNRFQTLMECQTVCPMKNQCNLKFNHPSKCDPNNLNVVRNIYHYDVEAGKCKRIEEFHCGDHTEFFTNENNCNKHCVVPSELRLIAYDDFQNVSKFRNEICGEPLQHNVYPLCTKLDDWIPKFYYNHLQERCVFFYYNGCDGMEDKGNRFSTQSLCEEKCLKQPLSTKLLSTDYPTTHHYLTTEHMKILNDSAKGILYKPGTCPDSNYRCTQVQENSNKCNSDGDCQNSWKCCPCATKSSILSMCIEPLSCMTTKYGCCADRITFATDEQHLRCKKTKPTIDDSSLPEQMSHNSQNDLVLNCQVSGDPKPIISWRHLGNNSFLMNPQSIHWDLLQPFWTGQIKIVPLEYKYGLWVCQTNNDVGMDEKEVFVHKSAQIEPFLRIYIFDTNQKELINVTVNNKIVIHCPIYGFPRPVITWFFNKIAVNATIWSLVIFNRNLLIEKTTFIHAGIWTCRAENNWGTISYKIRLRVLNAIQIIVPQMGTKIKANQGQQIILFCNVQVEGNCSVNWYWEIGNSKTKLISSTGIDSRILNISSFQNQYLGSYVCEASNNFSDTNIKYTIVPYNTNEISVNPNGAHFIGTTVILECPIKPSRKVSKTIWKKDNIHINTNSAQLKLVLRSKLESGFYSCEENKKTHLTYLSVLDVPKHL